MDLQTYNVYVCCPSWCPTNIREDDEISWYSPKAIDIRKSVLNGTYHHCDHQVCPSLNKLLNTNEVPNNFITIKKFKEKYKIESLNDVVNIETYPEQVLFGFDRSCNFKCPSCRKEIIPNEDENSNEHIEKLKILKTIEDKFSSHIKSILITGSGDPFYSKIYRNYLINFNSDLYPKLEDIRIITNGKMLNKKMWDNMSASKHIKYIEISIDAGTKYTYENITRLNGDWDILIENLKFLSTLTTIDELCVSFVVSEKNYLEMEIFYNIMSNIFKNSSFIYRINYSQHVYWQDGMYSELEVKKLQVFNNEHPFYVSFIDELKKIYNKKNVTHNFHHLI
jgi:MoaA/NifB/PqqE/SkfB family radical SAM enzyme